MIWQNRLKLLVGLVVIVAIVAVSTMVFNRRQSEMQSTSATIAADEFTVGTDYGGTVTGQFVRAGDRVRKGERLLSVRSLALLQELARNPVQFETTVYTVQTDGTMTFLATVDGVVATVDTKLNDFVQAGQDLVTIDRAGSLTVTAEYTMTSKDYERLQRGAVVDIGLPDGTVVPGRVASVAVQTVAGKAATTIEVESDRLVESGGTGLVRPGTPVDAVVHLREDPLVTGLQDAIRDLQRRIGL